jgi:DNA/RNA-binding domain of Phe-tRNA-synthetase-like protein
MKLIIDPKIFEKYPSLNLGVVIARGINNSGEEKEVAEMLRQQEKRIKENHQIETLFEVPKINVWRKVYKSFGAKDYRASVENLYRMVLKGIELRHINKLVDIYNFISLKHMFPVGGEDIDKMQGDLQLAFASADEPEVELLGEHETKSPHEGEVIYKDDVSAVCRRWNWREAARTKLTEETRNAVLVIEGLEPAAKGEVELATEELADLVKKYCTGEIKTAVLNSSQKELEL